MASLTIYIRHCVCHLEIDKMVDHLAEYPIDRHQPMMELFPDESTLCIKTEVKHPNWRIYFDEAVKVQNNEIEAVRISPAQAHCLVTVKLRFPRINSIAEYKACITSLKAALDMNVEDLEV